jgi:hypothetical protein
MLFNFRSIFPTLRAEHLRARTDIEIALIMIDLRVVRRDHFRSAMYLSSSSLHPSVAATKRRQGSYFTLLSGLYDPL